MLQAYRNRDLAVLMSLVYESGPQGTPAYDNLLERLLARRNTIMVKRMRAQIEAGNAFIAIGAAHLAGEHGLLRLLGYPFFRVETRGGCDFSSCMSSSTNSIFLRTAQPW